MYTLGNSNSTELSNILYSKEAKPIYNKGKITVLKIGFSTIKVDSNQKVSHL